MEMPTDVMRSARNINSGLAIVRDFEELENNATSRRSVSRTELGVTVPATRQKGNKQKSNVTCKSTGNGQNFYNTYPVKNSPFENSSRYGESRANVEQCKELLQNRPNVCISRNSLNQIASKVRLSKDNMIHIDNTEASGTQLPNSTVSRNSISIVKMVDDTPEEENCVKFNKNIQMKENVEEHRENVLDNPQRCSDSGLTLYPQSLRESDSKLVSYPEGAGSSESKLISRARKTQNNESKLLACPPRKQMSESNLVTSTPMITSNKGTSGKNVCHLDGEIYDISAIGSTGSSNCGSVNLEDININDENIEDESDEKMDEESGKEVTLYKTADGGSCAVVNPASRSSSVDAVETESCSSLITGYTKLGNGGLDFESAAGVYNTLEPPFSPIFVKVLEQHMSQWSQLSNRNNKAKQRETCQYMTEDGEVRVETIANMKTNQGDTSLSNPMTFAEVMQLGVIHEKLANLDKDIKECKKLTSKTASDFVKLHEDSVKVSKKVSSVKQSVQTAIKEIDKVAYLDGLIEHLNNVNNNMILKPYFVDVGASETAV